MKPQATYNIEEEREKIIAKVIRKHSSGQPELSYTNLNKHLPIFGYPILKDYKIKKWLIDYNFYTEVFKVILHNGAILKSENLFNRLVIKLNFYDDWQGLFKQEILKEIESVLTKTENRKKDRFEHLNLDLFMSLNNQKNYLVEEVQPANFTFYSIILNKSKTPELRFIDFISEVISVHNIYRYVDYTNDKFKRNKFEIFSNIMQNLCIKLYKNDKTSTSIYSNMILEEVNFKSWIAFSDEFGYSHYDRKMIGEHIKGYEFLTKILSKFYYLLFLKSTLRKGVLDLSRLDKQSGLLGLRTFTSDQYKNYKTSINFKTPKIEGFVLKRNILELKKLHQRINGIFIKEISFQKFSECFAAENMQEKGILEWQKSKALLAYFINELKMNDFLSTDEKIWLKTEICFKNQSSDTLKSSLSRNPYPKGYEEIDKLF